MTTRNVAILGAGQTGLAALKQGLDMGLKPIIFEKSKALGGGWQPHVGNMWHTMCTNTSRFSTSFSDLPSDDDLPLFPHNRDIYHYLCAYAKTFKLEQYIQFNCFVTHVKKNQSWEITYCDTSISEPGVIKKESFDYVIIATSVLSKAYIPDFKGIDKFKGTILHSNVYKHSDQFKDKNVVVIGNRYSGGDIASDVSKAAKKVINVIRKPNWIMPRRIVDQQTKEIKPWDFIAFARSARINAHNKETKIFTAEENKKINDFFNAACEAQKTLPDALQINESLFQAPPVYTISDAYINCILNKEIFIKISENISFDDAKIYFDDGTHEDIDVIIFATGYRLDLSFMDQDILDKIHFSPTHSVQPCALYKCTFHPDLPGIGFVGLNITPYFAIELQAKWVAMVFSGKVCLPPKETMLNGVNEELSLRDVEPLPQFRIRDIVGFCDSIAEECNLLPNIVSLEKRNSVLYEKLLNSPCAAFHYLLSHDEEKLYKTLELYEEKINKALESERMLENK